MRIKGWVTGPAKPPSVGFKPYFRIGVQAGKIRRQFDFLLDTGSDITALTTSAFKRLRFQPKNVGPPVRKTGGIAERAPTYRFASPATLRALNTNGKIEVFPDFQLYAMETPDTVPTLLGRDFLAHYKLKVHYDPAAQTVILED